MTRGFSMFVFILIPKAQCCAQIQFFYLVMDEISEQKNYLGIVGKLIEYI